jgi:asparagine synthase (glutamine-hydrolysing)
MCGILGVRKSYLDDPSSIEAAVQAMAWRGPDGVERIQAGDWHLAVARLAITDPDHGQPLWSADGRRVIAFNGAVTSAGRERAMAVTRTGNDAELPLHRLAGMGAQGLLATSGHYAMAILEPETDRLWLARDPEGEKPLYIVAQAGRVVAFASTVASLRRLGFAIELPDVERARFLRFGFDLGPTMATPGLTMDTDLRGVRLHHGDAEPRTWTAAPECDAGSGSLFDRVVRATARCAEASVPVGLCLSGGVDSSCLAAALSIAGRSVTAYQFRAVGSSEDERTRARAVAVRTGMELRLVDAGPEILRRLPELTGHVGLPLGDPSVLAVHALARSAAAEGTRILLGGEGADELFLGYRRHRVVHRLPSVQWRRGISRLARVFPGDLGMSTMARLRRAVAAQQPYDSLLEVAPPAFRRAVLRDDLVGGELPVVEAGSALLRARHIDREHYLRRDLLPKLDTALMAAGVEGRCPFLDPEVVASAEASSADPRSVLGKRPLRDAFAEHLPRVVLDGAKLGFGLPLDRWLREDAFLPDLLADVRTRQRAHLRPEGLAKMLDRHRSGGSDLGHALYLIAALECHLRDVEDRA